MTFISPAARATQSVRARAALLTAALIALILGGATAAVAAPSDEAPASDPLTFTMAPNGGGLITAGQPLTVTVQAANPSAATVAAGEVSIAVSDTPLASRDDLTAWLGAAEPAAAPRQIGTVAVDELAPRGRRSITTTLDPVATGLSAYAPGAYPLTATYASAQGALTAASVIVVPGDTAAPLGVVVPITAPPGTEGLLTADELEELTEDRGQLRTQLTAVTGTAAILAIDPAIPAAIRVLGSSAPEQAVAWLDDLLSLPNSRFALQFGDADLAVQIEAGLSTPLAVTTLAPFMSSEDFAAQATGTPTATPDPDGDAGDGLPTLEDLLDIGPASGSIFWPATGTAGSAVVAALGGSGGEGSAAITLVPSSVVSGAGGPWARSDGAPLLVYDAEISAALRTASTSIPPIARDAALASASAYTALATATGGGAPLLVTVDRAAERSGAALRETVLAATSLTGRPAVGLDALTTGEPAAAAVAEVAADADRVATLTGLLTGETDVAAFATILDDPALLTGPERASILQLIGNGWREDPAAYAAAVDAHRTATATTLRSVAIVPPSDLTLVASSASIGFTVRNDLPWPASLVMVATPMDPRLIVQNTTTVEAGPQQSTRVEVPVEARVGSGESTVQLQLRAPTMTAVGDPVSVDVAVRAEWESVGVVIMVVVVTAMIVLGVIRTLRRIRARRSGGSDG